MIDVHEVQAAHDVHVDDDDDDDVHDVQAAHDVQQVQHVQHDAQAASWKLVLPCKLMRRVLPLSR